MAIVAACWPFVGLISFVMFAQVWEFFVVVVCSFAGFCGFDKMFLFFYFVLFDSSYIFFLVCFVIL